MALFAIVSHDIGSAPDMRVGVFEGAIAARSLGTVASYRLVAPPCEGGRTLAWTENYPRWTEPVSALFARLLERCPPSFLPGVASGVLRFELSLGNEQATAIGFESLMITPGRSLTEVRFDTRYRQLVAVGPATAGRSLRQVLRTGLHVALGWADGLAPVPSPLCALRRRSTGSVVELDELPWYPRLLAQRHFGLPASERVLEWDRWKEFVESAPRSHT